MNKLLFRLAWGFFLALATAVISTPDCIAATKGWTLELNKGEGKVEFMAVGRPASLKIHGEGTKPSGSLGMINDKDSEGEATFSLENFATGIKLRDEHMKKKYLEVEKFPMAKFKLVKVEIPENLLRGDGKAQDLPFEGMMALHGQEKKVAGTFSVERAGAQVDAQCKFAVKLSDFGIAIPSFAGITVAEDVNVIVSVKAPVNVQN